MPITAESRADQDGQLDGVDDQDPGQAPEEQAVDVRPAGVGGLQEKEDDRQQQGGRDEGAADHQGPRRPAASGWRQDERFRRSALRASRAAAGAVMLRSPRCPRLSGSGPSVASPGNPGDNSLYR